MDRFNLGMGGLLVMGLLCGAAAAQTFPAKPVRIITSGAGGGPDTSARLLGGAMSATLGQPFIVENRSGAGIQAQILLSAPADGYTNLLAGVPTLTFPLLQEAPYHPVNDFAAVTQIDASPSVLAVHPSLPVNSVKELVAYVKARPGQINYGAASVGGSGHLMMELFKSMTGTNLLHVPYKTTAATVFAALSGEVQVLFHDIDQLAPPARAGKLRLLAVTSAQRTALAPDLPTVAESGVPGYEFASPNMLWTNGKTPSAVVARLNEAAVRYLRSPEGRETFLKRYSETVGNSPAEAQAVVKKSFEQISELLKQAQFKKE